MKRTLIINSFANLLMFLMIILISSGCKPGVKNEEYSYGKNDEATVKILENMYNDILLEIKSSYEEGDWITHSNKTIKAINFMNLYPTVILMKIDRPLRRELSNGQIKPYLSLVLEYSYRLQRAPTIESTARFDELAGYFNNQKKNLLMKSEATKQSSESAIIRTINNGSTYRVYSANAVLASSILQLNTFGKEKMSQGHKPEYFVRLIELLRNCRESGALSRNFDPEMSSTDYANQNRLCEALYAYIYEKLGEVGLNPGGDLDNIFAEIGSGYSASQSACIDYLMDDEFYKMIQDLENYLSCIEGNMGYNPSETTTDIFGNLMVGSGSQDPNREDWRDYLRDNGYNITADEYATAQDLDFGVDGLEMVGVSKIEGTNSEGETMTVEQTWHFTSDEGSEWGEVTSTTITVTNADGTSTSKTWRGSPNNATMSRFKWKGSNGASYDASFDENGKLESETIVDEDGTVTEVTYDEDGNIVSEETTNQPPDEFGNRPPCNEFNDEEFRDQAETELTKLETLIIPNPESIEPTDNPCFNAISNNQLSDCKSVALCVESNVLTTNSSNQCNCEDSELVIVDPQYSGYAINCGPNSEFDPTTGTCKNMGSGNFSPGIINGPPPPPINIDFPEGNSLDDIIDGIRNGSRL